MLYGPAGQTITVQAESSGGRVRVRIDDEGPGVPESERDRIWEPYVRLSRDAESATGGSGIGLSVVRELVTMQGGTVTVGASDAGGARFTIDLPEATDVEGAMVRVARTPSLSTPTSTDPGDRA